MRRSNTLTACLTLVLLGTGLFGWGCADESSARELEVPAIELAASARAAERLAKFEYDRLPVPDDLTPVLSDDYYGIYFKKDKLGWLHVAVRTEPRDGVDRLLAIAKGNFKLGFLGQELRYRFTEERVFEREAPHRFLGGHSSLDDGDESQTVDIRREADHLAVEIREGKTVRRRRLPLPDYDFADAATTAVWFRQNRTVGDQLRVREFDLHELRPDFMFYEITAEKESMADGVPVRYYEAKTSSFFMRSLGTFRVDRTGQLLSGSLMGTMEFRVEPKEVAQNIEQATDLFAKTTVRIDQPLGDPTEIAELVVRVTVDPSVKIPSTAWQHFERVEGEDGGVLSIGKRHGVPQPATAEAIADALRETVGYPTANPRVRELAKRAVGDATDARERVRRLVEFVDDYVEDSYTAEPLTVAHILDRKAGDCSEHAALFATLARAAGIPCREVSGVIYMGDEEQRFGGHAWNQVAIDGAWWPVDSTWREDQVNGTHLLLSIDDGDMSSFAALFAGMELELVSVKRR